MSEDVLRAAEVALPAEKGGNPPQEAPIASGEGSNVFVIVTLRGSFQHIIGPVHCLQSTLGD